MSELLKFRNRSGKSLDVRNKSARVAEIVLYGDIGENPWDESAVSAKQFSDQLKLIEDTVTEIHVHISSGGGDVFQGLAMYNRLKQHKAKKIVYVDGLAASIASVIMLAGDEIVMGEGSLLMIHKPWTIAMGDSRDFENTIDRLMDVEEQLLNLYVKKTKIDRNELRAMLEKETWMDSAVAVELGFADRVSEEAETLPIAASYFDKASWITKRPKAFKSEASVIKKEIESLKNKINQIASRK